MNSWTPVLSKYPIDMRWQVIWPQDMNSWGRTRKPISQKCLDIYPSKLWSCPAPCTYLISNTIPQYLSSLQPSAFGPKGNCFFCFLGSFLQLACIDELLIYDVLRDCSYRRVILPPWVPQLCICPRKKLGRSMSCLFACSWHLGWRCSSDDDRRQKQRSSAFTELAMY